MNGKMESVIDIEGESLWWQGRPAPRCFTFRHWGRSMFWLGVFAAAGLWQWAGWNLYCGSGQIVWALIPVPLLVLAFCLSIGRVARARLEWEHVYYVLSDKKLRIQCGIPRRIICFDLTKLSYVRLDLYGRKGKTVRSRSGHGALGKIYLEFGGRKVVLDCVEYAEDLFEVLRRHLDAQSD